MKIYNDTIQYNESEVAYNGGWFQSEIDSPIIGDFLLRNIGITHRDDISLIDRIFGSVDIEVIENLKVKDIVKTLSVFSIIATETIKIKDELVLCCIGVILNDKTGIVSANQQVLSIVIKNNIAIVEPIIIKCAFKVNPNDLITIEEIGKYGFNGDEIIWQWNDVLSDNKNKWNTAKHTTALWIDKNKVDNEWTDRIVPNKF